MYLYIIYRTVSEPETIRGVRATTVYPHSDGGEGPELVIHFEAYKPQQNIPLRDIHSITTLKGEPE